MVGRVLKLKLVLTQPLTELELELGLSLAILIDENIMTDIKILTDR